MTLFKNPYGHRLRLNTCSLRRVGYNTSLNGSTGFIYSLSIYVLLLEIHLSRGDGLDPINRFHPVTFLCLSQARTWILSSYVDVVLCSKFREFSWEVVTLFVDNGRMYDHLYLKCLFIMNIGYKSRSIAITTRPPSPFFQELYIFILYILYGVNSVCITRVIMSIKYICMSSTGTQPGCFVYVVTGNCSNPHCILKRGCFYV